MPVVHFYDQILSGASYKETSSRKLILQTGAAGNYLTSGINILYSPGSTGEQSIGEYSPYGVPPGEIPAKSSVILGGKNHTLSSSSYSVILGGNNNAVQSAVYAVGDNSTIIGGTSNIINDSMDSFIIGGDTNTITTEAHGNAILNSSNVTVTANAINNSVIQVASGVVNGKNNMALLGHNVVINGNSIFSVGANLNPACENSTVFSDGRRFYSPRLDNAFYIRFTNGVIFPDYINIKSDNVHSPMFGDLGESLKRNKNVSYTDGYGGVIYLDGFGAAVNDITGINLSVGYKSLPIIIGERAIGPVFCDWSGVVSGVVYRSPSNAINIGYDNGFNTDDILIGHHNIRNLSKTRSLDKQSDPFSRRAMVLGAHNTISGNDAVIHGVQNKIYTARNTLTLGNFNTAHGTNEKETLLTGENGFVTGVGPSEIIWKNISGIPITPEDIYDLTFLGSYNNEYIGTFSTIIGSNNSSISRESRIIGYLNYLSGSRSNVIGMSNKSYGDCSFVGGTSNIVRTTFANVIGNKNYTELPTDDYSGSLADNNIFGSNNFIIGKELTVIGTDNSLRIQGTGAVLRNSIILGNQNIHSSSQGATIGYSNRDWSDSLPDGNFNTYIFGDSNQTLYTEGATIVGVVNKIQRIKNGTILGYRNAIAGRQGLSNRAGLDPAQYANYNLSTGENTLALGFHAFAEGSNKIIFGSYTKGLAKAGGNSAYGSNIWNQGSYQRMFLNWKGFYSAAGTNTIELTLDGILPTGSVQASNYYRGRAFMTPGKLWNGFVNVIARKGLSATESIWSQLRHVTIYRDQAASQPIVLSDTVISTQSGNFSPSNPSEFGINFSGISDYVVVTARGNHTSAGYASGTAINWHVVADFAETNTYYETSKGVVINQQKDTQPEGFTTYQIYAT